MGVEAGKKQKQILLPNPQPKTQSIMYLNSRLTRPIRVSIMLFLIACFFIISPLVILYTVGYRYDFKEGLVRQTGVLNIDVEPKDSSVFLDNIKIEKGIPVRLSNLNPGTYNVKIEKDGYMNWEKDITVESKRTTYIRDITLFKQSKPTELFADENILETKLSYNGQYFLLLFEKEGIFELFIHNNTNGEKALILRTEEKPVTEWSPYQNYALAKLERQNKLYIFSAINPTEPVSYQYQSDDIQKHQWPRQAFVPILFVHDEKNIIKVGSNIQNLDDIFTEDVWFIDDDEKVWSFDRQTHILTVPQTVGAEKTYNLERTIEGIYDSFGDYFIAKSEEDVLIINLKGNSAKTLYTLPVQNLRYNHTTQEWSTWSPWEVWDIYRDGKVSLLNRTSEQVSNVFPLDGFGLLLIKQGDRLVGFNPGFFLSHDLFENKNIELLGVNVETRKIYFQGKVADQSGIWELEY